VNEPQGSDTLYLIVRQTYLEIEIMKIREHRGGLTESMATVAEIEPTIQSVVAHITNVWKKEISPDSINIKKYGIDTRIGWDTSIVTVENHGVFGMIDGQLIA